MTADCNAGGANDICEFYTSSSPMFSYCDLDINGGTTSTEVWAIYNDTTNDYEVWGTDAQGNDFCCVESEPNAYSEFRILGTAEVDTVHLQYSTYDLEDPSGTGVGLLAIVHGAAQDDIIYGSRFTGTEYSETLYGDGGEDTIDGDDGDDVIYGGTQCDSLTGGAGDDQVHGEAGDDNALCLSGNGGVYGDAGDDLVTGGDGDDRVRGGADADVVLGGSGQDFLYGDAGDDVVCGGVDGDPDTLYGGADNDELWGAGGGDVCNGGTGIDDCDGNGMFSTCTPGLSQPAECP